MFEKGDIVECIQSHTHSLGSPAITKWQRFVVNGIAPCGCAAIDIGLKINFTPAPRRCIRCGNLAGLSDIAFFHYHLFRKIEPEYRTVEISESINKQVKELAYN